MGKVGKARDPKISWFVWKGERSAPLAQISPTYRLRYSHEHGYRFDKQEVLWDVPRLSTPERTERWWNGLPDASAAEPSQDNP